MQPLNVVEIETHWGFRSFELYNADITKLDFHVDLLVISAFAGSYYPTPNSVVGALHSAFGLDLQEMAAHPWMDFRPTLGSWVSDELSDLPFARIISVELRGGEHHLAEALENVFVIASLLELKGVEMKTLALPVLGAGDQMLDPAKVIGFILPHAQAFLGRSTSAERIAFVEKDEDRAALLSNAINDHLGRVKIVLPKGELVAGVRKEILRAIEKAQSTPLSKGPLLGDMRHVVSSDETRSFEFGNVGRRLAEAVVDRAVNDPKEIDLYKKIELLASLGVAPWIQSYLHVLRVFGNESSHERDDPLRKPVAIDESDVALCLFCLLRVLSFYLEYEQARPASA